MHFFLSNFSHLRIDRYDKRAVAEANRYFMIEGCIALFVSFILNLFVIGVFANSLYNITYGQAYETCQAADSIYTNEFNNTGAM